MTVRGTDMVMVRDRVRDRVCDRRLAAYLGGE